MGFDQRTQERHFLASDSSQQGTVDPRPGPVSSVTVSTSPEGYAARPARFCPLLRTIGVSRQSSLGSDLPRAPAFQCLSVPRHIFLTLVPTAAERCWLPTLLSILGTLAAPSLLSERSPCLVGVAITLDASFITKRAVNGGATVVPTVWLLGAPRYRFSPDFHLTRHVGSHVFGGCRHL